MKVCLKVCRYVVTFLGLPTEIGQEIIFYSIYYHLGKPCYRAGKDKNLISVWLMMELKEFVKNQPNKKFSFKHDKSFLRGPQLMGDEMGDTKLDWK